MAAPKVGVADDIVPVLDGELGGEGGATAGVAIVEDFEQILSALADREASPQSSRTRSQVLASR